MIWLVIALGGIALVLILSAVGSGWAHRVLYSWRHARHLVDVTLAEPVPAPEYGSMILAEERGYWRTSAWSDGPDWREQTAADLSPEALAVPYEPSEAEEAYMAEHHPMALLTVGPPDSGPGDSLALAPGPDQDCCDDPYGTHAVEAWATGGFQMTWDGVPELPPSPPLNGIHNPVQPSRLADTGDIRDAALLAEVTAELHRQDADVAGYLSRLEQDCIHYRVSLAGSLA